MDTVKNQAFRDETVQVDYTAFSGCSFTAVTFVFGGGTPPTFTNCSFVDVALQFEGAAAGTLKFLNELSVNEYPAAASNIAKNIRNGGI